MDLSLQIILAFGLDLLIGDLRFVPHPVQIIGGFANVVEKVCRKLIPLERIAGIVAWVIVISCTGAVVLGILLLASMAGVVVKDIVSVIVIYTTIASRGLTVHSTAVYKELDKGDIAEARKKVGMIVGRDTDNLDESQIVRATVETVAENTVDGVTAPLMFAFIAGPVGAMVYKAVNTLDSMFGYKNEKYLKFGWASAKIDDAFNYLPARLTWPVMCITAGVTRMRMGAAFATVMRDGRKHASPNAGFTEAAMAGALGVALGGSNDYFGQEMVKPVIGEPVEELNKRHIKKANVLMVVSSVVFLAMAVGMRFVVIRFLTEVIV